MSYIRVNDIFDELKVENKRLLNELLFANRYINKLVEFKSLIDLKTNQIKQCLESDQLKRYDVLAEEITTLSQQLFLRQLDITLTNDDITDQQMFESYGQDFGEENYGVEAIYGDDGVYDGEDAEEDEGEDPDDDDEPLRSLQNMLEDLSPSQKAKVGRRRKFLVCEWSDCGRTFASKQYLDLHVKSHLGEKPKTGRRRKQLVCEWPDCGRVFASKQYLDYHMNSHTGERRFVCEFPNCSYRSYYPSNLKLHVSRMHRPDPSVMDTLDDQALSLMYPTFKCTYVGCDKSFKTKDDLKQHSQRHSSERPYKCNYDNCDRTYKSCRELRQHKLMTHLGIKQRCDWPGCDVATASPASLRTHKLLVHHNQRDHKCEWPGCEKAFKIAAHLRQHIKTKHDIPDPEATGHPLTCDWPECDYQSTNPHLLKNHRKVHWDQRNYKCEECGKLFKTQRYLSFHVRIHTDEKPFVCQVPGCEYKSCFSANLQQHMQRVHQANPDWPKRKPRKSMAFYDSSELDFKCPFDGCTKAYNNVHSLTQHKRFAHTDTRFKCDWPGCDYSAPRRSQIKVHQISVHSDQYDFECGECGKKFKLKLQLNAHMKTHSGEKPEKRFECSWPGCPYKCARRSHLDVHMHVHTGERNFPCDWPQCGKSFKVKQKLIEHMRIHNNIRPYVCHWPGCHYRCYTSSNLKLHLKVHRK